MRFIFLLILLSISPLLIGQIQNLNTNTSLIIRHKRINFNPQVFYRAYFSGAKPVLTINPGDTVSTESVDAGGFDKNGIRVTERGNPLTGPFYIEGAAIGDVIAVKLLKVSLNRNYATTLEGFVPKILPKNKIKEGWRDAKLIKWNLDLVNNIGSPAEVHNNLKDLKIPLKPFLGCVGVAPDNNESISSGASGSFGGNLDFYLITHSSTVYLPVYNDGALLFLGDGHAAQGDGELNGDALETSMRFEFTVEIIKKGEMSLEYPKVENNNYIMTFGIEKNLDKALKTATSALIQWLQKDYQLSFKEVTQVVGHSIEYRIPKIAATKVEVVAMISKEILAGVKKQKNL